MKRREFITMLGGAGAWPVVARAQQGEQLRRVGVLLALAEDDPEAKSRLAAFRLGLAKRGWSESSNIQLVYRFAAASARQPQPFARELVALQPDVVLAHTPPVASALQRESRSVPIVFVNISDPIGLGLIASLARPGGNLTGVVHYETGIVGKWLAMLKEIAPHITRAALVANPKSGSFDYFLKAGEVVAPSLAIEIVPIPVETAADIERSIASFARVPNGGLVFPPDVTTITHRDLVIALAANHRLPAIYPFHLFVLAGGLMCYGTDQIDMFRLAAFYVDRILRGDKPAELPVQAPTKFETTLNLKTAKALGLSVPPGLLVAADEVIE
jgi:putative tryptophan/tyrosine transport system substrate-binding protein